MRVGVISDEELWKNIIYLILVIIYIIYNIFILLIYIFKILTFPVDHMFVLFLHALFGFSNLHQENKI